MPVADASQYTPPSSSDFDDVPPSLSASSELFSVSSTHSGSTSPTLDDVPDMPASVQKKKKKKKAKKSSKAKEPANAGPKSPEPFDGRPPVLCISRNKHWRYISSYHVCAHFPHISRVKADYSGASGNRARGYNSLLNCSSLY